MFFFFIILSSKWFSFCRACRAGVPEIFFMNFLLRDGFASRIQIYDKSAVFRPTHSVVIFEHKKDGRICFNRLNPLSLSVLFI
jgi:hypothetical protein